MAERPSSRPWHRGRLTVEEAGDLLKAASFRLDLGPLTDADGVMGECGTGFFVDDGLALTADHNVRPSLPQTRFAAYYGGQRISLEWVEEWSSREADIAVLRLVDRPDDLEMRPVATGFVDPLVPARARQTFWAGGRAVVIFGYPVRGFGQQEHRVDGLIDTTQPLVTSYEPEEDGAGGMTTSVVERLVVVGTRVHELQGISGAAIVDLALGMVIGVEGAYVPDTERVLGTEIAQLLKKAPGLRSHFHDLMVPVGPLRRGIAAVSERESGALPTVVLIEVSFGPGALPSGVVPFEHLPTQRAAQGAVRWLGEYMRRFRGRLGERFRAEHWQANSGRNTALFRLPQGWYSSQEQLTAGMALASLVRFLGDVLVYDLDLACDLPAGRLMCGAGIAEGDHGVVPLPGLFEALASVPPEGPALVLYARAQADELRRLAELPGQVRFIPADTADELAESLLAEVRRDLEQSDLSDQVKRRLGDALADLHTHEQRLKEARAAELNRHARLADLGDEVQMLSELRDYLESSTREMRERLRSGQSVSPPSAFLAELTRIQDEWRSHQDEHDDQQPGEPTWTVLVTESQTDDAEVCRRLFRRLATFYHPDANLDPDRQKGDPSLFPHLVEHRADRLWLEALAGATEPLRLERQTTGVVDEVEALFDHLFALADIHRRLLDRIGRTRDEVASYGAPARARQDAELEALQTMVRVHQYDVEVAWRELKRVVGREPFGPLASDMG